MTSPRWFSFQDRSTHTYVRLNLAAVVSITEIDLDDDHDEGPVTVEVADVGGGKCRHILSDNDARRLQRVIDYIEETQA